MFFPDINLSNNLTISNQNPFQSPNLSLINEQNNTPNITEEENENAFLIQEVFESNALIHNAPDTVIVVNEDDYFPFTKGVGLEKLLESMEFKLKNNQSNIELTANINNKNYLFKTTDFYVNKKGKLKKQKKKRKYNPDNIRKKIKGKFHNILNEIINTKIKNAGSGIIPLFEFFPQNFITNVSVDLNKEALNLTYEKLIEKDFKLKLIKGIDKERYENNKKVLEYLNQNPDISENSEFDRIKKMKYSKILKAYFISSEFEQSLVELFKKKEKINYIESYIQIAKTYVDYFTNHQKIKNDNDNNDIDEERSENDNSY